MSLKLLSTALAVSNVASLVEKVALSEPAQALLQSDMTVGDYLAALEGAKLNFDVVPLLAKSMPINKAIQWASASSDMGLKNGLPYSEQGKAALNATKQWLSQPEGANLQMVADAAKSAPLNEPGAWTAWAPVFADASSQIPAGAPDQVVAAANGAAVNAVVGAIRLAASPQLPEAPEFASLADIPVPEMPAIPELDMSLDEPGLGLQAQAGLPGMDHVEESPTLEELQSVHEALEPFIGIGVAIANS